MSALRRLAREVWLPRLTRRGVGFLIIGSGVFLAALFLDRRDLIFVGALLVAMPITAACYVGFRQVKVQVSRTFRPAVVSAGNSLRVAVQVRNRAFRPLYGVRWSESTSAGLSVPGAAALPALARSSGARGSRADRVVLDYRLTPTCRGLYDLGPLVLHTYDPFGLAYGRRLGGTVADLIVTPPVTALPGLGLGVAGGEGNARELLHHHNPHSDELIAREYRPGDPLRRVNWPATARHGEIMVRQEEQRSIPSARLVLDTTMSGVPDHDSLAGSDWFSRHDDAFETAIELTASIGAHLIDAGFRVAVSELGASQLAPGAGTETGGLRGDPPAVFLSPGGSRELLEGLAGVVPVLRGALRAEGQPGRTTGVSRRREPTFAVLVAIDEEDVADLARLSTTSDPAIAFVIHTMGAPLIDRLTDTGWTCIPVRSTHEIASAWDLALRGRSAHDAI